MSDPTEGARPTGSDPSDPRGWATLLQVRFLVLRHYLSCWLADSADQLRWVRQRATQQLLRVCGDGHRVGLADASGPVPTLVLDAVARLNDQYLEALKKFL